MPQALPALAAWAAKTLTVKVIGAFILKTALLTAASYGLSKLMGKKSSGLTGGAGSSSRLDASRDIMQAQRVIYGRDRVGHTVRLRHKTSTGGQYLYYIAVWAGHECDGIEKEFFGEDELTFDGSGHATGKYAGVIRRTHHLGAHNQLADANFVSEIGDVWTEDHRLQGKCYTAYRFTWDANKFPGGLQAMTAVIRGRKIYDPRDVSHGINDPTTWTWSANSALCEADYMRGVPYLNGAGAMVRRFGLGLADDRIDWTILTASANASDEAVPLDAGGTEPRYETNGSFDTDSEHSSVITSLESAMAGRSLFIAGEAHIRAGIWNEPDFDITEAMIRRGQRRTRNPLSRREKFNLVRGSFTNAGENYKKTPLPTVKSSTFITNDGGELSREMDLPFTSSATMGQRIVRQAMLRSRQGTMYQFPCNLQALPALTGENVRITRGSLGWTNKHFEVVHLDFKLERGDRGGIGMALDITGQSTASSIFDWSTSLEGALVAPGPAGLHDPSVVETPADVALATSNFVQKDGTISPRLKVTWTAAVDRFVISGGHAEIEYKKSADSTWLIWNAKIRGDAAEEFITDVLAGVDYDVRARFVNSFKVEGAYCTPVTATVSTDTTVPSVPIDLAAISTPGSVALDWTPNDPAVNPDFAEHRVYRHTSDAPISATLIWSGRASGYVDFRGGSGTKYYWVSRVDTSNNESAKSTVASGTANPATGNKIVNVFKRAAAPPSAPTGNYLPSGWTDAPPAVDGNPLYISTAEVTSTGVLVSATWSTPVRLDGANGAPGAAGDGITVEYSIDGSTSWHGTFASGDFYMRIQVGSGGFGSAIKISGELEDGEVTTIKIGTGAVTGVSAAYTSGSTSVGSGSWTTVQDVYLTTTGEVVFCIGTARMNLSGFIMTGLPISGGGGTTSAPCLMRIRRDGSTVVCEGIFSTSGLDTPSAGSVHYELQVFNNSGTANFESRSLLAEEIKR